MLCALCAILGVKEKERSREKEERMEGGRGKEEEEREKGGDEKGSKEGNGWTLASNEWSSIK